MLLDRKPGPRPFDAAKQS